MGLRSPQTEELYRFLNTRVESIEEQKEFQRKKVALEEAFIEKKKADSQASMEKAKKKNKSE